VNLRNPFRPEHVSDQRWEAYADRYLAQRRRDWADEEVGIVSAERERLSMERRKAASALEQDPSNPQVLQDRDEAEKAQVDYIS
jgi:hypothetical protein